MKQKDEIIIDELIILVEDMINNKKTKEESKPIFTKIVKNWTEDGIN